VASLDFLADELRILDEQGLRRRARPVEGAQCAVLQIDGREAVNFSSNNYLGLADHPTLRDAAHQALDELGVGSGASRLIAGNLRPHRRLEESLADFHGAEAALLFNSGYQANIGIVSALAGPGDVIFSDALNHASLIDGCRLSKASIQVYPHRDLAELERLLAAGGARRRFIISDSVFSMDGTLAPLRELKRLSEQHGAVLVVDEAHATGTVGPSGRGLASALDVTVDVHMATLSKALGAFGAYVTGSRNLVDFLMNRARSFVFTTALPPSVAAAGLAAIALTRSPVGDTLRAALRARVEQFGHGLRQLGLLMRDPDAEPTPIFPILVGDERRAMEASEALLTRGIFAQGIRPPTVPAGTSRLRFTLMATHKPADLDRALDALGDLIRIGLIPRRAP
jgi:8-amino-7-oxononanoate synthase